MTGSMAHLAGLVGSLLFGLGAGHEDFGFSDAPGAAIAPIHDGYGRDTAREGLGLLQDFRQGVTVVEVLVMRYGPDDDPAGLGQDHASLGSGEKGDRHGQDRRP